MLRADSCGYGTWTLVEVSWSRQSPETCTLHAACLGYGHSAPRVVATRLPRARYARNHHAPESERSLILRSIRGGVLATLHCGVSIVDRGASFVHD